MTMADEEITSEELEEKIQKLWPTVLDHFFPRPNLLAPPALVGEQAESEIMHSVGARQVTIDEQYVRALMPYTEDTDQLLEGILLHTVSHYMLFPNQLSVALVLMQMAYTSFDWLGEQVDKKEFGDMVFKHYIDVVDNLSAFFTSEGGEAIAELYSTMGKAIEDDLMQHPEYMDHYRPILLNLEFYGFQFKDKMSHKITPPPELTEQKTKMIKAKDGTEEMGVEKSYVERMHDIPFLTKFGWPFLHNATALDEDSYWHHLNAMRQYGKLLIDIEQQCGGQGEGEGEGEGQGQCGDGCGGQGDQDGDGQNKPKIGGTCGDFGDNHGGPGSQKPSPMQMAQALDQIRQNFTKHMYDQMRQFATEQFPECFDQGGDESSEGMGIGQGGALTKLNTEESQIEYYMKLSLGLPLYILPKKLRTPKDGGFPMMRKPYEPGDPMNKIDVFRMHGGIMPGITPVKVDAEDKTYHKAPRVPHALILMDSSGSMPNPSTHKSDHVLCGMMIANNYLINDSLVGAINFSGQSYPVPYTNQLYQIAYALVGFQAGGTEVDLDILEKILPPEEKKRFMGHGNKLKRDETENILDWMNNQGSLGQKMYQEAITKEVEVNLDRGSLTEDMAELTLDSLDVYIITDGGIFNLDALYKQFDEMAKKCRITILHCPPDFPLPADEMPENVRYIKLKDAKDLMGAALGVLEDNVHHYESEG